VKPALIAAAAVVGAGVGVGIAIADQSPSGNPTSPPSDPGIAWPAGARPAPNFVLRGENGAPVDLRSFRGRPVIVAFIDPVCRNLCPLEARVLSDVPARLPAASRPAVVAVSVNPWNQTGADLRLDAQKWRLTSQWRWALGGYAQLANVWKHYSIGVRVRTKTLAGVTVHEVDHTEAAYVIDAAGDERAVFVFPYRTEDVVRTLRLLTARPSSSQR
jgi:cytochrome oxidase Cu insertion factor (SCO1/SenC/PrrC family)